MTQTTPATDNATSYECWEHGHGYGDDSYSAQVVVMDNGTVRSVVGGRPASPALEREALRLHRRGGESAEHRGSARDWAVERVGRCRVDGDSCGGAALWPLPK
jgi:hypothetical protein